MTVAEELARRGLPELLVNKRGERVCSPEMWEERREELKEALCGCCYGYWPRAMGGCGRFGMRNTLVRIKPVQENGFGGKALVREITLEAQGMRGIGCFSFYLAVPKRRERPPVFLYLSFAGDVLQDMAEELTDNGYAVAAVCYEKISPDREDGFSGKVGLWAYGCSLIMDCLMTLGDIDTGRIAIVGHSRLGKAALLCGALDSRFSMVIANESGAAGAALFRGKRGERLAQLRPYWFRPAFQEYAGREEALPYDQHFLLALTAPRALYVASAREDVWADPDSEFLSCAAASPAYELFGEKGLVYGGFPACGEALHEGRVGYHLRAGTHHLSRDDWHCFMKYRERWKV